MGVLTLLRRRLRTHPLALIAVVVAALMSMVVVATLQLLQSVMRLATVRNQWRGWQQCAISRGSVANAEHALLGDRGDEGSVGAEHATDPETASALGRG